MPVLLLIPLLVVGVFALWVVLLPLSLFQRYRAGTARRRVQPLFVSVNAWLLAVSTVLFIGFAAIAGHWVEDALLDALAGLAVGSLVGMLGLVLDRTERMPAGLFRTPNRWVVLGLALLVAGRIALGLWIAFGDATSSELPAWATRGGLLAVGGLLLGYGLATAWGLRRRLARH